MPTAKSYTARPDGKRRIVLRGPVHEQYHVRHRADGVIELRPQVMVDVASISARTLADITRSMEALDRGEASAPVDLDETFPGLDEAAGAPG